MFASRPAIQRFALLCALAFGAASPEAAQAQGNPNANDLIQKWKRISWQKGPSKAQLGSVAEIQIPAGYKFTGSAGCGDFMLVSGNIPQSNDVGLVCPNSLDLSGPQTPDEWFLVFDWDPVGYVKDDEKLDADALLTSLKTSQEQANQVRRAQGLDTLQLLGWSKAPFYDPQTNLLTWATRVKGDRSPVASVNYNSRLLGRGGVMGANLVISEQFLDKHIDAYRTLLKGYSFLPGQRHAEFREGDKLAGLGLTALIAGGAAGLAAKTGLLAKFGKFIIYGVVAAGAGIAGIFRKLFGKRESA